jgi:putative nucleotidyltransferase with HDIG domain
MRAIGEIALLISVKTRAFQVKGYETEVKSLFRHSLGTAVYAQEIARIRRRNVEEAFLCGLLHDVGRPVMLQALVDLYREFKVPPDKEVVMGLATEHHARLGGMLVSKWSLPEALSRAILFHHQPSLAGDDEPGAMVTALADELAHATLDPEPRGDAIVRSHPALSVLDLYPEDVDKLLAMHKQVAEMVGAIA